jgi:hypothetical protein
MANWSEISHAIVSNPDRAFSVRLLSLPIVNTALERFPILQAIPQTKLVAPINPLKSCSPPQSVVNAPVATAAPVAPVAPVATAAPVAPVAPVATAAPVAPVATAAPVAPVAPVATAGTRISEPHTSRTIVDPIVLGLEHADPLYSMAQSHAKHQIETESALELEKSIPDLYKSQGGRARGWTKSGLETMLRPRCASGGKIRELDRVKAAFIWQLAASDKATSAFLDFLCVARKIRVAIWYTEEKRIVLYPAADYNGIESKTMVPLYHITSKGELRHGLPRCSDLIAFCDREAWALLPPLSIQHTLSGLTLAELESIGKKLGMADVDGNKTQRVAAVAVYKLRQRLLA